MAGDWIKMRVNLDTDPSVIMMAAAFDTDELCIVGRLWKVWAWADQHTADGNAVRVTHSFLDRITNCPGFAKAMREAGWLEGRDGALTFPQFSRHNGQPAKARALGKDRVEKHRNAPSVTEALPEKRREELKPPNPPVGGGAQEGFEQEVYRLYPRKTKKRSEALAAILTARLQAGDDAALRSAVLRYAKTPGLDRENWRGVPCASKWFGDGCWRDYLTKPMETKPTASEEPWLTDFKAVQHALQSTSINDSHKPEILAKAKALPKSAWLMLGLDDRNRLNRLLNPHPKAA